MHPCATTATQRESVPVRVRQTARRLALEFLAHKARSHKLIAEIFSESARITLIVYNARRQQDQHALHARILGTDFDRLLVALGLFFQNRSDLHSEVPLANNIGDRIGAFWLVACAFGPFFGWVATALPPTTGSWRCEWSGESRHLPS